VTTNRTGTFSRIVANTAAACPQVTTATAALSASWTANSAGGSSGFVGLNTAPASRIP